MKPPVLFLATSCLQGQDLFRTVQTLAHHVAWATQEGYIAKGSGIQLCPGNHPAKDATQRYIEKLRIPIRYHHTFSWDHKVGAPAWRQDKALGPRQEFNVSCMEYARGLQDAVACYHWDMPPAGVPWSLHPPQSPEMVRRMKTDPKLAEAWMTAYAFESETNNRIIEVMWGEEYDLATDARINELMDRGVRVALDVSHVFIGLTRGAVTEATWKRLQDYPRISEVHVSANDGKWDSHRPLESGKFGLDWARDWAMKQPENADTAFVYEGYWHKLQPEERHAQVALAVGVTA